MDPVAALLGLAAAFGAIGGIAGASALVKVFVVDRHVVKRDDIADERKFSMAIRAELESEIAARRGDRVWFEDELRKRDETIARLRDGWDACRSECQRLRLLVEGDPS